MESHTRELVRPEHTIVPVGARIAEVTMRVVHSGREVVIEAVVAHSRRVWIHQFGVPDWTRVTETTWHTPYTVTAQFREDPEPS